MQSFNHCLQIMCARIYRPECTRIALMRARGHAPRPTSLGVLKHTSIGPLWGPTNTNSLDTPLTCNIMKFQKISQLISYPLDLLFPKTIWSKYKCQQSFVSIDHRVDVIEHCPTDFRIEWFSFVLTVTIDWLLCPLNLWGVICTMVVFHACGTLYS